MERFPQLESLCSRLLFALFISASSTQLALAEPIGPPGYSTGDGATPLIAQQSGWPNNPPAWQNNPAPSSMPAPPPQQTYQQSGYPQQQDMGQAQAPVQGYANYQNQPQQGYGAPQIQPGQLQGYPVSQQPPGLVQQQGYPSGDQQQQYAQNGNMQYGQAQQSGAPAAPAGWTADYPSPSDASNSTASQVPIDTAQPKKAGIGSMIGKALGGVAKISPTVAGAGMAGMTNMALGRGMMGMGGYGMPMGMGGMGGYGMPMGGYGMPMGGYGMPMGMGGMGMGGMGMGGMGMPMGGMGVGGNMMMNSILNQGLRMLQR